MSWHHVRGSTVIVALIWLGFAAEALAQPTFKRPELYPPTPVERDSIKVRLDDLSRLIAKLPRDDAAKRDLVADIVIFHKAAYWALRHDEFYTQKDVLATLNALVRGRDRARLLADGRHPWTDAPGSWVRGFLSKVDSTVQPYAVVVPPGIDFNRGDDHRARLDVVLHGRGATLNEIHFIQAHEGKAAPADSAGVITLHVFGRTNNAYRWAGETDVFEAIEAVKRNYPIDERRIVLRGFSMGGAGAWHLGLHYPSLWSSVEAGAGFTESKTYARLGTIPDYQQKALHIYDAVDYAGNAFNVPIAGYGGEKDSQRQASINIENALKSLGYSMKTEGLLTHGEGIDFLRVVGADVEHKVDPASAKLLKEFHDRRAVQGLNLTPPRIRFTTYTLKYNEAAWLTVEQLLEHYRRASIDAEIVDKQVVVHSVENVLTFSVDRHIAQTLKIGDQEFPLESAVKGLLPNVYFKLAGTQWRQLEYDASRSFQENSDRVKQHNVQGPIDDAFSGSFLCVRGTGTPWNRSAQRWADERLRQFTDDWNLWMRGEIRVKNDSAVTDDDIEGNNIVLFGDPGSNRVLAKIQRDLPVDWSQTEIKLGERYSAHKHAVAFIAPNPLNPRRYVVVNSGHTFSTKEFAGTNALLFPRLGDYAVFEIDDASGNPKVSGYFDERWKIKDR